MKTEKLYTELFTTDEFIEYYNNASRRELKSKLKSLGGNIKHLKEANSIGLIPNKKEITIIGNIELLKKDFSLRRNFWNYPALLAFRSKQLTHFFYFSKYAKILHDFMYLFRKRPIE